MNLTQFYNIQAPVTPWGVVAAASAATYAVDGNNQIFVPSADGHVYAMDVLQCAIEMSTVPEGVQPKPVKMVQAPAHLQHRPLLAGREELRLQLLYPENSLPFLESMNIDAEVKTDRKLQPTPQCPIWTVASNISQPFAAPTRYLQNPLGDGRNLLFVTETSADLQTGGVLHLLDAATGIEIWNQPAIPPSSGQSYGLVGIVPALAPPVNNIVIVPFGTALVAIQLSNGAICDVAATPTFDLFVSSPMISSDGTAAYVHSSTGALWKFLISPGCSTATLTYVWGCTYDPTLPQPPCTIPSMVHQHPKFNPSNGKVKSRVPVDVSEYGFPGGWYQPSTKLERAELYNAIVQLHNDMYGEEETQMIINYGVKFIRQHNGVSIDMKPLEAAALAARIPRDRLYSIITPSGYLRLGPNSKPALSFSLTDFGGVFPYATPAISLDDQTIIVSNYAVGADSSVVSVNAQGGTTNWNFYKFPTQGGPSIPFGTSRSSPAVDVNNYVYVGSDVDWALNPTTNLTLPALFAFDMNGNMKWVTTLGEENITVGSASPIITDGVDGDHRAYMVAIDSVISMTEGLSCPSADPILECSGHGRCNCAGSNGGLCSCFGCWYDGTGGECNTYNNAACVNGQCDDSGACDCNNCYATDPITGLCTNPLDCGTGGTCSPDTGDCSCSNICFALGPDGLCSQAFDCGPSGSCSDPGTGQPNCTCSDSCYSSAGPGQPCKIVKDCGPGGQCQNGQCVCQPCWSADSTGSCTIQLNCLNNGICDTNSGQCICTGCWTVGSNGSCINPVTCPAGGTCSDDGVPGDPYSCTCTDPCYSQDPVSGLCVPKNCANGQCSNGQCFCNNCFSLDGNGNCTQTVNCGNGQCNTNSGQCTCNNCWLPDYTSGPPYSCTQPNSCSGHGICAPQTGQCMCSNLCYSSSDCSYFNSCNNHGSCMPEYGRCTCSPGFAAGQQCASCDACHYGAGCAFVADHCGDHGTCNVNADGTRGIPPCICDAGWSGDSCTTSADAANASASAAVAAGVTIPLTLLIAGFFGIFFFAKASGLTLTAAAKAAPTALINKLGFGKGYSTLSSSGSGGAPSTVNTGAGSTQAQSVASRLSGLVKPDASKSGLLSSSGGRGGGSYGSSSTTYSNL